MSIAVDVMFVLVVIAVFIKIVILRGVYREKKLTKAWDEGIDTFALQETYISRSEGETRSEAPKKRGRPVGSKNKVKKASPKVSRTTKKTS